MGLNYVNLLLTFYEVFEENKDFKPVEKVVLIRKSNDSIYYLNQICICLRKTCDVIRPESRLLNICASIDQTNLYITILKYLIGLFILIVLTESIIYVLKYRK